MKNVKKIIIAMIVIIIVIISVLVYKIISNKENTDVIEYEDTETDEHRQDELIEMEKNSTLEDSDYVVFSINDLIQQCMDYVSSGNYTALYSVIDKKYIKDNNINVNNCSNIFNGNIQNKSYYVQGVYKIQDFDKTIYYSSGLMLNRRTNGTENYYLKIKVKDDAFSIAPIDIGEYNNAKDGKVTEFEELNIDKNNYNKFNYKYYTSQEIATRYLKDYFMKNKKEFNIEIASTKCEVKEKSVQYKVTDIQGKSYNIIVYSAMNYEVEDI